MSDPLRVDSRRSTGADTDPPSTRLPPPGNGATAATPPSAAERSAVAAARYDEAIGQAPAGASGARGSRGGLSIFLAHNAPVNEAERTARVQAGLDAFRDHASGPYTAEGQTVSVAPHFAMGGGFSHPAAKDLLAVAAAARPVSLAGAVGPVQVGRGTPEQVTRLTQALIDAGKLPAATDKQEPLAARIHQMQWRYGIGFDCAGYTQQAAAAAVGKPRAAVFPNPLDGAISFARMTRLPVTAARAGDMFVLNHPANENVGHKTVVYAHQVESTEQIQSDLAGQGYSEADIAAFGRGGPCHRFELDASWGAGERGDINGGYRRETAMYNEATGKWAWRTPSDRGTTFHVTDRPFDHPIDGAYRPRP
jgi:hypothetical protein